MCVIKSGKLCLETLAIVPGFEPKPSTIRCSGKGWTEIEGLTASDQGRVEMGGIRPKIVP